MKKASTQMKIASTQIKIASTQVKNYLYQSNPTQENK